MGFIKGLIYIGLTAGFAVYAHKQWPQHLDKAADTVINILNSRKGS